MSLFASFSNRLRLTSNYCCGHPNHDKKLKQRLKDREKNSALDWILSRIHYSMYSFKFPVISRKESSSLRCSMNSVNKHTKQHLILKDCSSWNNEIKKVRIVFIHNTCVYNILTISFYYVSVLSQPIFDIYNFYLLS